MNPLRKAVIGTVLVGSTVLGGAVGATLVGSAGAAETTTSSTAPAATSTAPATADPTAGQPSHGGGPHQANGITEELLTGDAKTKAEAAAQAAQPDATVERSETDAEGAAYEVHMRKADGSEITVKLDSSFNVTGTEQGRG